MNEFVLQKSLKPEKKYQVSFINPKTSRENTLHFGATGYTDFTTSGDVEQKNRYLKRHTEPSDSPYTRAFWAETLLWNKPTIKEAIKDIQKRFGIKIKLI